MRMNDWYWIDGTPYCPACVQCDTPAIDQAKATRGPCESGRCACCGEAACLGFRPTHRITLGDGSLLQVMLDDGCAYQRCEWDAADAADYERTDDGRWTFQGQPFAGRVEEIAEDA